MRRVDFGIARHFVDKKQINQVIVPVQFFGTIIHNTVGNWVKTWESVGIAGLCRKNGQGRKLILSINNAIHTDLLDKTVETHRQNVKAIRSELVKELARPMSSDTVKRFLKKILTVGDESVDAPMKGKIKNRI